MSHKKFLEKFRETLSRKHNKVMEDEDKIYSLDDKNIYPNIGDLATPVMFKKGDKAVIESLDKYPDYNNPHTRRINYGVFSTLSHETDKEVQAIIDILSDPLILRHRGYK